MKICIITNLYPPYLIGGAEKYAFQLAQTFNEFYHAFPVLNSEQESFRLELVKSFSQVLKNALNLLGIQSIENM